MAFRHPTGFCVVWLLVTGMTLEMALDGIGRRAYSSPTIAVVKGAEIGLAVLCGLRSAAAGPVQARPGPTLRCWRSAWRTACILA